MGTNGTVLPSQEENSSRKHPGADRPSVSTPSYDFQGGGVPQHPLRVKTLERSVVPSDGVGVDLAGRPADRTLCRPLDRGTVLGVHRFTFFGWWVMMARQRARESAHSRTRVREREFVRLDLLLGFPRPELGQETAAAVTEINASFQPHEWDRPNQLQR